MYEERDMIGLYKHLKKSVGLGGRPSEGQQYVKDETGVMLKDKGEILQKGRCSSALSSTLNPPS